MGQARRDAPGKRRGETCQFGEDTPVVSCAKGENEKCDESGTGRDESGRNRDESAAGAGRRWAGGGSRCRMNPWVIRRGGALVGPHIDTNQPHVRLVIGGRIAATNLRTHADPVQHWCRPTSAPVLNRFYLSIVPSSLLLSSSIHLWGTPRGPIPLPDRSLPFVRDFRPLIPANGGRLLHGRLDG